MGTVLLLRFEKFKSEYSVLFGIIIEDTPDEDALKTCVFPIVRTVVTELLK